MKSTSLWPAWATRSYLKSEEGEYECVLKKMKTIKHYNLLCIFTNSVLLLKVLRLALQVWIISVSPKLRTS
ncbi:hypothetical protein ACQP3J_31135, partial [Escherichia coli]